MEFGQACPLGPSVLCRVVQAIKRENANAGFQATLGMGRIVKGANWKQLHVFLEIAKYTNLIIRL